MKVSLHENFQIYSNYIGEWIVYLLLLKSHEMNKVKIVIFNEH